MWTVRILKNGVVTELPPVEGALPDVIAGLVKAKLIDDVVAIVKRR